MLKMLDNSMNAAEEYDKRSIIYTGLSWYQHIYTGFNWSQHIYTGLNWPIARTFGEVNPETGLTLGLA